MNNDSIKYFISQLSTLVRGNTPFGLAPHKPILLLSLFEQLGEQTIHDKILIDKNLVDKFKKNWQLLINTSHRNNILLPLHHLSDGLGWELISKKGEPIKDKFSSLKKMESQVAFGRFSNTFTEFLNSEELRFLFISVVLDTYFPDRKDNYWSNMDSNPMVEYFQKIETQILQESKEKYWTKEKSKFQFHRDWKFKDFVKKAYQNTCCISKLQVDPNYGIIEACHILPHAEFGNDSIHNGITLCVNLHKAFDNGLISIGKDYEVIFNKKKFFNENNSPYNLSQFKNQKILLPPNKNHYPYQEFLQWHRNKFNF